MTSLDPTAARAQLNAVLASDTFRSSETLRRLLGYLGERTLDGTAGQLKEYTIGVEVFGKSEAYDPQTDSSVRVQMGKLRQRLEDYYRTAEGLSAPMLLELPARQFTLRFAERPAATPAPPPPGIRPHTVLALVTAVALVCLTAGWFLGGRQSFASNEVETPADLREFWKPMFDSPRPVLVCIGTPLFIRLKGTRIRYSGTLEEASGDETVRKLQGVLGDTELKPSYEYTGAGEATAAFLMSRLFARLHQPADLRRSNSLTWDEIMAHNVVFVGAAKFNPQLNRLPVEREFEIRSGGVANLHPRLGEPEFYKKRRLNDTPGTLIEDYALISRIPGPGEHTRIIWLGGSSTWSAWAAADCLIEPRRFRQVLGRLRDSAGRLPTHFEAVVRIRFQDHVPVEASYVTHRALQGGTS